MSNPSHNLRLKLWTALYHSGTTNHLPKPFRESAQGSERFPRRTRGLKTAAAGWDASKNKEAGLKPDLYTEKKKGR